MGMRWGLGPVFVFESLLNARRWQVYAGRSSFVLVLLLGIAFVWITYLPSALIPGGRAPNLKQMAEVGEGFFYALAGIEVSLILLAAPAAAAGSMGVDRARGTIVHMMVTDLSDVEIVLGTLAARLAPVFGLIACGVPVTALAALLGGIDLAALAGAFVVSLVLAVLGCVLALTLSVWVTKTHEVLMAVYVAEGLWLLALPIWLGMAGGRVMNPPVWFQKANPYVLVFAPYSNPGFAGLADFAAFVAGVLALSAALMGLSIARLRRVVVEQAGRPSKAARRRRFPELKSLFPSWPSPTLDDQPVLWREWHRSRPSRLARWLWGLLLIIAWALAAWGTYGVITRGVPDGSEALLSGLMLELVFGMLMLSATAPTALAEERVRGSLDVLLATPLSTGAIVVAKWWGVYRRVLILVPLPLFAAVLLSAAAPDVSYIFQGKRYAEPTVPLSNWDRLLTAIFCPADFLASGALLVSLGLVLAIWVPRLGRAVALSVILFFLLGIGWPILVELSFASFRSSLPTWTNDWLRENRWLMECVTALSPIIGPIPSLEEINGYALRGGGWRWAGLGVVILIKSAAAGGLLWLSVLTFDRCLSRVSASRSAARDAEPVVLEELVPEATF